MRTWSRRIAIAFAHNILLLAANLVQPDCNYDREKLLVLPFEQFDQDLTGGWRALGNENCLAAAAELLRLYRNEHEPISDGQRSILLWHEGQVYALSGDYARAAPLLLAGVPLGDKGDFTEYALGTVAFLRRDKPALIAARERLAALPEPDDWSDAMTVTVDGKPASFSAPWPPNINVLDGLIQCFERPYKEAYFCRPLEKAG